MSAAFRTIPSLELTLFEKLLHSVIKFWQQTAQHMNCHEHKCLEITSVWTLLTYSCRYFGFVLCLNAIMSPSVFFTDPRWHSKVSCRSHILVVKDGQNEISGLPSKVKVRWDMASPMTAVIATNDCLEQRNICHRSSCLQPVTGGQSNNTNQLHNVNTLHCVFQVENSLSTYEPHACVVVYSIVDRATFRTVEDILNYLWRENYTQDKSVILVGNKADLARSRVIPTNGKNRISVVYIVSCVWC